MDMGDGVRPSETEIQLMRAKSLLVWSKHSQPPRFHRLPLDCVGLRNMLGRVPAYLAHGILNANKIIPSLHQTQVADGLSALFTSGKSTWQTSDGNCKLEPRVLQYQLLLGVQRSTACAFTDDSRFKSWPGVQGTDDNAEEGNYLAVLFFAWAYILSVTWLEIQPACFLQSDRVRYLDYQVQGLEDGDWRLQGSLEINLDYAEDDAARWWAALLSPGEGWRATISRNGQVYRSPWSVCNTDTRRFKLRRETKWHHCDNVPPSSKEARKFLSEFCRAYKLRGQCSAALAAAMFIPFHNGGTVSLPLPTPYVLSEITPYPSPSLNRNVTPSFPDVVDEGEDLPYYMTLSCNGWGLRSLLHSTFFNAEVPCNLVGAWLEPAFELIGPMLTHGDYEQLATVLARRQPTLGPVWLGAIVTGASKPILQAIRTGQWAVDLHAAVWTATEQSFLTIKPPMPCAVGDSELHRDDECRLLFLTGRDGYSSVPVCPWKPFGTTNLNDTEIEVQNHAYCQRHYLRYTSWSWDLENEMVAEDRGYNVNSVCLEPIVSASDAVPPIVQETRKLDLLSVSEMATRSIFGWLRMTGYPSNEKSIRLHPWFDVGDSDEEPCDMASDSETSQNATQKADLIDTWFNTISSL